MDAEENEKPQLGDLWVANATEKRRKQAAKPSFRELRPLELTAEEAHEVWGHPSPKTISKLEQAVDGIKIKDGTVAPTWENCTTCIEAKLHKLVSRRPPEETATRPFERLGIDLVQLRKTGERCYNGDVWLFHAVCQKTKFHLAACIPNKSAPMLLATIKRLLARIKTQYGVEVRVVKLDGERGYSMLHQFFLDLGIKVEPRAPYTEEQNGLAERAGSIIIIRARAIRIASGLPKELANECAMTAVYLLNRTPIESLGWKTPYEVTSGHKPSMAHVSRIGVQAYYLNHNLKRGDKLESRALIGHLVGYDSTNIFRIWLPESHTVIRTRDVIFRSNTKYDGSIIYADLRVARTTKSVLDIASYEEEGGVEELELDDLLNDLSIQFAYGYTYLGRNILAERNMSMSGYYACQLTHNPC